MNIFILDKSYNQIGMLSNEGANPQAPYYDDLYTQELDTGADIFEFTTLSTSASRDIIEIGNHILFQFNNRHRLFAISTLELEHKDGMNVIHVYAEGVGFQLLETFLGTFEGGEDTDGDGEPDEDVGGEFHTYETFLQKVLADTDWNYQIVSGDLTNINMGKEVTFPDGKNIYALLQDSMQTFGGVELEFRAVYSGGSLNKTIYAYAHKGRGSFVGQRFEYGINVKGIKKTQEIVDEMDENVILYEGLETIDGLNVEVTYEVDFALRSYEVEELEIGDTHYVIDNDFEPPQIEARIGKIEISFSDPTKNKCYLANFKKITGSKPEDPDGEDVEDIIDDKMDDIEDLIDDKIEEALDDLDLGELGEHDHDRLVYHDSHDDSKHPLVYTWGAAIEVGGENDEYYVSQLSAENVSFNFGATNETGNWAHIYMRRFGSLASETSSENTARIYTNIGSLIPYYNNTQYVGDSLHRWDYGFINNIYSNYVDATNAVNATRHFGYTYQVRFDRDDMQNVTQITNKQDLLDFIINDINIYKYSSKAVDNVLNAPDEFPYQVYYGLLAEDFVTHNSGTDCSGSEVAYNIVRNMVTDDTNNDGDQTQADGHNKHTYNLPALITALIGAFQQHVENGDDDGGDIDLSGYATETYVKDYVDDKIDDIKIPDLSDYATIAYVDEEIAKIESGGSDLNIPEGVIEYSEDENNGFSNEFDNFYPPTLYVNSNVKINGTHALSSKYIYTYMITGTGNEQGGNFNPAIQLFKNGDESTIRIIADNIDFHEGAVLNIYSDMEISNDVTIDGDLHVKGSITSDDGSSGGIGDTLDTLTVKKIIGGNPAYGEAPKYVEIEDALRVKKIFGGDDGGSVEWEGDLSVTGTASIYDDAYISGDLHVYGQIIQENGAATISSNTQEHYEEELRIRDEKIANLEDRLARIEEMLGINN